MAFKIGDDLEELLFRQSHASEFVQTGDNAGPQRSTRAEAARDWNIAANRAIEPNCLRFRATEEHLRSLGDHWIERHLSVDSPQHDAIVEIDREAERVETGTE